MYHNIFISENIMERASIGVVLDQVFSFLDVDSAYLLAIEGFDEPAYLVTILLDRDSRQAVHEQYDRANKLFGKYPFLRFRIYNIAHLEDTILRGNLFFVNLLLKGTVVYISENSKMRTYVSTLNFEKLVKRARNHYCRILNKTDELQQGAGFYIENRNYQLAVSTLYEMLQLLFRQAEELILGRHQATAHLIRQQQQILEFSPSFVRVLSSEEEQDKKISKLLYNAHHHYYFLKDLSVSVDDAIFAYDKADRLQQEVVLLYEKISNQCDGKNFKNKKKRIKNELDNDITIAPTIANENDAFHQIVAIITEHAKTAAIYCFGKCETAHSRCSKIYPEIETQKNHSHLYLLVFVEKFSGNTANDLSDKIATKTNGLITATLIIHKLSNIKKMRGDQQYFFWKVMQDAQLLYQKEENIPYMITEIIPSRNLDSTAQYIAARRKNVSTLLEWLSIEDNISSTDEVKITVLYQLVEQSCLGLIRVFMGYSPNHFSLGYLFNLCEYFTRVTADFFPRKTQEDQHLFDVLKHHPHSLRYSRANDVDSFDFKVLERRCNNFIVKADEVVETELNRLKEVQNKEDKK
ncbi:hypothetical protein ACMDB5_10060 [Flavobacterium sp. W1B]|uniref:hypothetical protein n=1 Tax=Flavobacterium sp. W1B TaxID=3394146 RepID=UPI0039BD1892